MKISYNWLKWYIPEAPEAEKLADIFTYHVAEVESFDKLPDGDFIFDIKILPNRAHDLLSHHGIAKEIASLLNIQYKDPSPMYKVPDSKSTDLKIKVETDKCPRYMGRIVRNVKVGSSLEWVVKHLESIGQRSINSAVDAANITMFDCGQPIHCFDLDKVEGGELVVRYAKEGEQITTLDNKEVKLKTSDMIIADSKNVLAIAGVKGGKIAEVDSNTKNIIIEVANFNPTSVRKTAKGANIFTDAVKRFENDLSPELCDFAMLEISALFVEYGAGEFEEVVDIYPTKQEVRKLSFHVDKISKILGEEVSIVEVGNILERYKIGYKNDGSVFEIIVPPLRLDLEIEEDMAEEIGRIIGYDKVKPKIPKIEFKPKVNETYAKIVWARNKLLNEGYSEVMTYAFSNKGEVEVLASASDKKFLRTNLEDGLKESMRLNTLNSPLLGVENIKVFEIGTVFKKDKEEIHVVYGDKKKITEVILDKFISENHSSEEHGYFSAEKFLELTPSRSLVSSKEDSLSNRNQFKMWPKFPFILRDIAVVVPNSVPKEDVKNFIMNQKPIELKKAQIFDVYQINGHQSSVASHLVFQSEETTLTDNKVNQEMDKLVDQIKKNGWQVR